MDHVLVGLDFAKCYIDDIIVFSSTIEEHGHPLQDMCECVGGAWVKTISRKV